MTTRPLLMIPGPIEFEPEVMAALGAPTRSHVDPAFIATFGAALERLRTLFRCAEGQPFVLAGSGTLAMDMAGANLVEPGDAALVVNTGYFGDRFGRLLERYGARVTHVRSSVGDRPDLAAIEAALEGDRYKLVTITHVDTSTGVLADVAGVADLARRRGVLSVVDGVCSVAGEALDMDGWGVDVALTASQKAVGVPPGLALLVAGERAMAAFRNRQAPVPSFYADWSNWLPIMEAYEARRPSYFGTPAVNLVEALHVSLGQILDEGLEARIARHGALAAACRAAVAALGLGQVPVDESVAAHTMTAPLLPDGISAADLLPRVAEAGAVLAGGLHPDIRDSYFRIGHMGATSLGDLLATVGALERGLAGCGYGFDPGSGVAAALQAFGRTRDT